MSDKITFTDDEMIDFSENVTSVYAEMSATIFYNNHVYNQAGDKLANLTFKAGRAVDVPPNSDEKRTMAWARLQNENDIRFQLNKFKNGLKKK